MSTVRIQNAHKFYNRGKNNEIHVINDITLELPPAGLVAIFGPSGCGKTTLLNAIGGLDTIAYGSIELFGHNIRRDTDVLRNRYIGYIFQNYNLNVSDTVYENVAAALRLVGMNDETEISERVTAALANVGMEKYAARTPDTLSGGQQQRVAIARAIVKNPAVILADEPTGNLDEANTVLVMDILKEISRSHLVLLVTHEAKLVDYYCDRVIQLVDGRVWSDRQNSGASGYVRRDKNSIYLGELPKTEAMTGDVTVSYYGEPTQPLHLTVVHIGGKLYLKADDPSIKWLDGGSEIRLVDGVFSETPNLGDNAHRNGHTIDMSRLTPVEGKHYGRLYHWKNALTTAWSANFAKKKKKRGRSLRVCLILLAIVMAFMTAIFGAGIRSYTDLAERHVDSLFYIPLDHSTDYSDLDLSHGQNGVDFIRMIGSSPIYDRDELRFQTASFMTAASSSTLASSAQAQSIEHIGQSILVAGTADVKSDEDIVITTAVADELIESSTVSYIDSYRDLLGLSTRLDVGGNATIIGVVESDAYFYYVSPHVLTKLLFRYFWLPVEAYSAVDSNRVLGVGEAVYVFDDTYYYEGDVEIYPTYKIGDTAMLFGRELTITDVIYLSEKEATGDGSYSSIWERFSDYLLLSEEDYLALPSSIGETDVASVYVVLGFGNDRYHAAHMQIHSTDPTATAEHLRTVLGEDGFLSPREILLESVAEQRSIAVKAVISVLVVLGLMCLCVFFIMRASFMSRVREVGILRAIGVSRRNLVFRFGVEVGVLLALTTLISYLLSSWFIMSLADAPLFSTIFYFPPWLAIGLWVVISAVSFSFGILPALILLRKTPSEILSKYDI